MTATVVAPARSPLRGRARGGVALVADRLDHAGRLALAAGLAGLVAIGIGSRVAMRVVALTSGHIGEATIRPESGAVPGTITFSGTTFLLMAGTFVGLAVGLAVLAVLGRWMPDHARRRWWLTVALASAVPAIGLLDPANPDFHLFGPRWLAIGSFAALPVAYGALVATWAPRLLAWRGGRVARACRVALGLLGLFATGMVTVGVAASEAPVLLPLPLLVVAAVVAGPTAWTAPGSRAGGVGRRLVPVLTALAAAVMVWRVVAVAWA